MSVLIPDYDLRCAVRDALAYLEKYKDEGELVWPSCDIGDDGNQECSGCAESSQLDYVIEQLKRGLDL